MNVATNEKLKERAQKYSTENENLRVEAQEKV